MKGLKRKRTIMVDWVDSSSTRGWHPIDEVIELSRCVSVGFLMREDNEAIYLAGALADDELQSEMTVIPKTCIRKWRVLRSKP